MPSKKKIPREDAEPVRRSGRPRNPVKEVPPPVDASLSPKSKKARGRPRSSNRSKGAQPTASTPDSLPTYVVEKQRNQKIDDYCWVCHTECIKEEMYDKPCVKCPRIYHRLCIGNRFADDGKCPECALLSVDGTDIKLTLDGNKLTNLLGYVLNKLEKSVPDFVSFPCPSSQITPKCVAIRDLNIIEDKLNTSITNYPTTAAFYADVKWIYHNSVIVFGVQHTLTNKAKLLIRQCRDELIDLEACFDCYLHSFEEEDFVKLCGKSHPLVWAKIKGYPYWPAKVLKVIDGVVNVRFFGSHDKGRLPVSSCLSLSEKQPNAKIRNKKDFDDALTELNEYIEHLNEVRSFEYSPLETPYKPGSFNIITKKAHKRNPSPTSPKVTKRGRKKTTKTKETNKEAPAPTITASTDDWSESDSVDIIESNSSKTKTYIAQEERPKTSSDTVVASDSQLQMIFEVADHSIVESRLSLDKTVPKRDIDSSEEDSSDKTSPSNPKDSSLCELEGPANFPDIEILFEQRRGPSISAALAIDSTANALESNANAAELAPADANVDADANVVAEVEYVVPNDEEAESSDPPRCIPVELEQRFMSKLLTVQQSIVQEMVTEIEKVNKKAKDKITDNLHGRIKTLEGVREMLEKKQNELKKNTDYVIKMTREARSDEISEALKALRLEHETKISQMKKEHEKQIEQHQEETKKLTELLETEKAKALEKSQSDLNVAKVAWEEETNHTIQEIKKIQWCALCLNKASKFCCWNTSYCSKNCQFSHWDKHKEVCLKKKKMNTKEVKKDAVQKPPQQAARKTRGKNTPLENPASSTAKVNSDVKDGSHEVKDVAKPPPSSSPSPASSRQSASPIGPNVIIRPVVNTLPHKSIETIVANITQMKTQASISSSSSVIKELSSAIISTPPSK